MATKNNPGQYDCYEKAHPDEPLFVLRANDVLAPYLVRIWASLRCGDTELAVQLVKQAADVRHKAKGFAFSGDAKNAEAVKCAYDMEAWRFENKHD